MSRTRCLYGCSESITIEFRSLNSALIEFRVSKKGWREKRLAFDPTRDLLLCNPMLGAQHRFVIPDAAPRDGFPAEIFIHLPRATLSHGSPRFRVVQT